MSEQVNAFVIKEIIKIDKINSLYKDIEKEFEVFANFENNASKLFNVLEKNNQDNVSNLTKEEIEINIINLMKLKNFIFNKIKYVRFFLSHMKRTEFKKEIERNLSIISTDTLLIRMLFYIIGKNFIYVFDKKLVIKKCCSENEGFYNLLPLIFSSNFSSNNLSDSFLETYRIDNENKKTLHKIRFDFYLYNHFIGNTLHFKALFSTLFLSKIFFRRIIRELELKASQISSNIENETSMKQYLKNEDLEIDWLFGIENGLEINETKEIFNPKRFDNTY